MAPDRINPFEVYNIIDFGAIPNDDSTVAMERNFKAFHDIQKQFPSFHGTHIWIPPGNFFFNDSLHVIKSIILFGSGIQGHGKIIFTHKKCSLIVHGAKIYFKYNLDPENRNIGWQIDCYRFSINKKDWNKIFYEFPPLDLPSDAVYPDNPNWFVTQSTYTDSQFPFLGYHYEFMGRDSVIKDLQILYREEINLETDTDYKNLNNIEKFVSTSKNSPGIKLYARCSIERVNINGCHGSGIEIVSSLGSFLETTEPERHIYKSKEIELRDKNLWQMGTYYSQGDNPPDGNTECGLCKDFLGYDGKTHLLSIQRCYNYYQTTNINNWLIKECIITNVGGHGIFVQGGDTQAGLCIGTQFQNIGGNGIYESSFLGNTYINCSVHSSKGYAIRADNGNAFNTFVGCYTEQGGTAPSWVCHPSIVLGGDYGSGFLHQGDFFSAGKNEGLRIWGGRVGSQLDIINPVNQMSATLLGDNSLISWAHPDEVLSWNIKTYKEQHLWSVEWANSSIYRAFYLTSRIKTNKNWPNEADEHNRGAGLIGFDSFLLGNNDLPIKITTLNNPPLNYGPISKTDYLNHINAKYWHKKGDIVYKKFSGEEPVSGYIGWVCSAVKVKELNDNIQLIYEWKLFGKIV